MLLLLLLLLMMLFLFYIPITVCSYSTVYTDVCESHTSL